MLDQWSVEWIALHLHEQFVILAFAITKEVEGLDCVLVTLRTFLDPFLSRGCVLAKNLTSVCSNSAKVGLGVGFVPILGHVLVPVIVVLNFVLQPFFGPFDERGQVLDFFVECLDVVHVVECIVLEERRTLDLHGFGLCLGLRQ